MIVSSIKNQLNTNFKHLSTMKKTNSSSDGAAGLLIVERLSDVSSNALDYVFYNNQYTTPNLKSGRNPIEDLAVPSYLSDMNENRILNVYRLFVQSSKAVQATRGISILLDISSLKMVYRKDILKSLILKYPFSRKNIHGKIFTEKYSWKNFMK